MFVSGFMSTNVPEIRALVLDTLQKLTKQTGALLKPHLALLMPALLESISGLESSSMNYLRYGTTETMYMY